jgi:hypothetical protein
MNATTQCIWLQGLLYEFGIKYQIMIVIFGENHGTIQISIDLFHRKRTKHIEIHMNYIWRYTHELHLVADS